MAGFPQGKAAVVGIDFGTACTGICWSVHFDARAFIACSPRAKAPQTKEPTIMVRILKDAAYHWHFGYEALERFSNTESNESGELKEDIAIYRRFKLKLVEYDGLIDPSLLTIYPDNENTPHSVMKLTTVVFKKMKEFAMVQVREKCKRDGKREPGENEFLWVLTVPADMPERCKAFIKEAAIDAGLRREDIELLYEPEAAAIALSDGARDPLFTKGQRFILVDCGGGTVDITAHEVTETNPLQLKPLAPKAGGNYGGEFVNMNIEKFIAEVLGDLYLPKARPKAYLQLRYQIEAIKISTSEEPEKLSLIRDGVTTREERQLVDQRVKTYQDEHPGDIRHYGTGQLGVTRQKFLSFFEPMLTQICNTIRQVQSECRDPQGNVIPVGNLIVTGGFADSKVLIDRINVEFSSAALRVRSPNLRLNKQSAIVTGAAQFGIGTRNAPAGGGAGGAAVPRAPISSRVSPYTYGIGMAGGEFRILARKGENITFNEARQYVGIPSVRNATQCRWSLYISDKPDPKSINEGRHFGDVIVDVPPIAADKRVAMIAEFKFADVTINATITPQHAQGVPKQATFEWTGRR